MFFLLFFFGLSEQPIFSTLFATEFPFQVKPLVETISILFIVNADDGYRDPGGKQRFVLLNI